MGIPFGDSWLLDFGHGGQGGRTRTRNIRAPNAALYHLSYTLKDWGYRNALPTAADFSTPAVSQQTSY